MSDDDFQLPDFDDEELVAEAQEADSSDFDYSQLIGTPVDTSSDSSEQETSWEGAELLANDSEELRALIAQVALEVISDKEKQEKKPRVYPNLGRFVAEQIAKVVTREVDGREFCWCSEWWKHPEALQRFEGLWHSWEETRISKSDSMLDWWRDFDYHFSQLTSSKGVFSMCREGIHNPRMNAEHQLKVLDPGDAFFQALLGDTEA